jgi:effector-binding domain-containing protein
MAMAKTETMQLTEVPEVVIWPEMHYVFVEKTGPFHETAPEAWTRLHQLVPEIEKHNRITGYTSLYHVDRKAYRAGVSVEAKPDELPEGVEYMLFKGGKYSRFVLKGPYSNLPRACGRVFEIVSETKLPLRDDYGIENYVNDPRTTPEEELVTEILVATA